MLVSFIKTGKSNRCQLFCVTVTVLDNYLYFIGSTYLTSKPKNLTVSSCDSCFVFVFYTPKLSCPLFETLLNATTETVICPV